MATDFVFECSSRYAAGSFDNLTAYVYQYDYVAEGASGNCGEKVWGANYSACWHHNCHGAELPFAYGTGEQFCDLSAPEIALTAQMGNAWGSFVRTQSPHLGDGSPVL